MAIDGPELKELLQRIDAALAEPQSICLIGSGATILLGQPMRATDDLDIWAQASTLRMPSFKAAVEQAGLGFDLKDEFSKLRYVQIIHPGIVQVPGYEPSSGTWFKQPPHLVWQGAKLSVTCPPGEAIIASKLMRGTDRDLEDCLWIMAAQRITADVIRGAIQRLPAAARDEADDNFDLIGLMRP